MRCAGCGSRPAAARAAVRRRRQKAAAATPSNAIKIGILSDCFGAFGAWYNSDIGGAQAYFIAHNGAKANGPVATDGITGGTIAGHPIKIVGYGCSNDNADRALSEARRLVESDGAQVLIGPLSGDEGIAIANYSKTQPGKTFINGTSGAQDTTLKVRSPNFFRFNGDGAQWNAGVGDYVYRKLGWRHAVVIMDDYGFGWTSAAGFIADFCADGGTVSRIYPPLNTTDYSSYVAQIPKKFDGLFSAVGGSGLLALLKQYNQARGPFKKNTLAGNIFLPDPAVLSAIGSQLVGAVFGQPTNEDTTSPNAAAYIAALKKAYPAKTSSLPAPGTLASLASSVFTVNYYNAAWALDKALTAVHGDLSNGQKALNAAAGQDIAPQRAIRTDHTGSEPAGDPAQLRRRDHAARRRREGPRGQDRIRGAGCHPDVRRHVQLDDAVAGPRAAPLPEAVAALAGKGEGGQLPLRGINRLTLTWL